MMRALALATVVLGVSFLTGLGEGVARAQPTSSTPEATRAAATEFDEGRKAYRANEFAEAADHFEAAFARAPRAEALRLAIRAHRLAKHYARAATLAAFAQRDFKDDAPTASLADETTNELAPKLHALKVVCEPACTVSVGGRTVTMNEGKAQKIFVDADVNEALVEWAGGKTQRLQFVAKSGVSEDVTARQEEDKKPEPTRTTQVEPKGKPLGPAVFIALASATAFGVGATIVSGVDALHNPGPAAVQRDCVGQGESCPTFQKGRAAELRTDLALGGTIGLGVATAVVGVFFTQWSAPKKTGSTQVEPMIGLGSAGVRGTF
jgi:hypothetical protein